MSARQYTQSYLNPGPWVIVHRKTGRVVCEIQLASVVAKINQAAYEVRTLGEHATTLAAEASHVAA